VTGASFSNYFLLSITFAVLSPYLPLYLKAKGFTPSRIGVLLGVLELAGVGGALLIARLADRRSIYRELYAVVLVVSAAAFLLLQLTTALVVSAGCMVLMGLAYRSAAPLLDSLVTRVVPDPAHRYGRLRVAGSISFIAASLVFQASGLITGDSAPAILIAFCAAALVAAAAAAILPAAPRPVDRAAAAASGVPAASAGFDLTFWVVIGVIFLGRFGIGAYYSFFSLYLKHTFPAAGVGGLWAIGAAAEVVTVWFSGPLIKRWGIRLVRLVSLAAISLRLGLFVAAPAIAVVAVAQLLHAFTFGTFHTVSVAYVTTKIAGERRGLGMAVYNGLCIGLSTVLASTAGGYILEAHGFVVLFVTYASVPLAGIAVLLVFGRRLLPGKLAGASRA
jgi:PPP family 3-phenylpropionic acid transporter